MAPLIVDWSGPASCLQEAGGCFCEQQTWLGLAQPSNTFSAGAFLLAAGLILIRSRSWLTWGYAGAVALVGLGTAYYHAHLTFLGQTIDFGGMNLVILIAPFHYAQLAWPARRRSIWFGYVIAVLLTLGVLVGIPEWRHELFGVLVAVVLWLWGFDPRRVLRKMHQVWIWRGFAVFIFGYALWKADTYRIGCMPDSWLQMHAIWHFTSAGAVYCLYRAMERSAATAPTRKVGIKMVGDKKKT
jgi:hypothetical protein